MADPPTSFEPQAAKASLRAHARASRRAFVGMLGRQRLEREDDACRLLLPLLGEATCVAFYFARGSELDPGEAMAAAASVGVTTALPHLAESGPGMRFRAWSPGDPLVIGAHGLREPDPSSPEVTPDIVVLPLLGFDRAGGRLGQGGGHYDRTLAAKPDSMRVGLAWSVQELERVPLEPWDLMLDAIVTERERIICP